MKTLSIDVPQTADIDDREAKMLLASKLYERGKLTLGQVAELAGYSKETFMELLADYSVALYRLLTWRIGRRYKRCPTSQSLIPVA
jgi:predicted HTH domain antitoxin